MRDLKHPFSAGGDTSDELDPNFRDIEMEELVHATFLCNTSINNEEYVTNITSTRDSNPTIVTASSNGRILVQTLTDKFCSDFEVCNELNQIIELKFDRFHNNLLWTAFHDGIINLWDLRSPSKAVSSLTDTSDESKNKKFNSFDTSSCGRILCAGTDRYEDDSFLLFWDIRKCSLAGGFWESHMDDITQVKFHPNEHQKMFSASTDGLINVYDLEQSSEDDALVDTLNTESSIEKISCTNFQSTNVISCITHTSDVQFWKEEDVQPYISMKRNEIAKLLKRTSGDNLYIVDVHQTNYSSFILVGCDSSIRGLTLEGASLTSSFELFENQQLLRCSCYNENTKILLTGGEKGMVDAWRLDLL